MEIVVRMSRQQCICDASLHADEDNGLLMDDFVFLSGQHEQKDMFSNRKRLSSMSVY